MKDRFDRGHLLGEWERRFLIIDTFPCRISRPKDSRLQNALYDGNKKIHSCKYEVAVRVKDGRICWLSGPAAGNVNDVAVIRNSGFLDFLLSDELVMADKLYISQEFDNFITPKKKPPKLKGLTLEKWHDMRFQNRIVCKFAFLFLFLIGSDLLL